MRQVATSRRFDMREPMELVERQARDLQRLARLAGPLLAAIEAYLDGEAADPLAVLRMLDAESRSLLGDLFRGMPHLHQIIEHPDAAPIDVPGPLDPVDVWTAIAGVITAALWSLPWKKEMTRFYQALGEKHIRAIDHYMLVWEPQDISKEAIQAQLRHAFGRDVQVIDGMPAILGCSYRPEARRLVPLQPGFPYYAVLTSYEMRGTWDAC